MGGKERVGLAKRNRISDRAAVQASRSTHADMAIVSGLFRFGELICRISRVGGEKQKEKESNSDAPAVLAHTLRTVDVPQAERSVVLEWQLRMDLATGSNRHLWESEREARHRPRAGFKTVMAM